MYAKQSEAVPVLVPAHKVKNEAVFEAVHAPEGRPDYAQVNRGFQVLQNYLDSVVFQSHETESGQQISGRDILALFIDGELGGALTQDEIMERLPQKPYSAYTRHLVQALETGRHIGVIDFIPQGILSFYELALSERMQDFLRISNQDLTQQAADFICESLPARIFGKAMTVAQYLVLRAGGVGHVGFLQEFCEIQDYSTHPISYLERLEQRAFELGIIFCDEKVQGSLYIHPKVLCHDRA